jgi:hypothetical protein
VPALGFEDDGNAMLFRSHMIKDKKSDGFQGSSALGTCANSFHQMMTVE